MADSTVKSVLLLAKELSRDEIETMESLLAKEKLSGLKAIAKDLRIRLTGASRKQDIIERLTCMAQIWTIQKDEGSDSNNSGAISYLTNEQSKIFLSFHRFQALLAGRKSLLEYYWSLLL